jgi:hypothetical protein
VIVRPLSTAMTITVATAATTSHGGSVSAPRLRCAMSPVAMSTVHAASMVAPTAAHTARRPGCAISRRTAARTSCASKAIIRR